MRLPAQTPSELTAEHLLALEPAVFQRLAVDLLREDAAGKAQVRSFEGRYGATDGGWDAELTGEYAGLSGTLRVEVKRNPDYGSARADLLDYIRKYPDGDLLYVTSAALVKSRGKEKVDEVAALEALGVGRKIRVMHGPEVATLARRYPYIARAYGLLPSVSQSVLPLDLWRSRMGDAALARLESERKAAISVNLAKGDAIIIAQPWADPDRVLGNVAEGFGQKGAPDKAPVVWMAPAAQPDSQLLWLSERSEERRPVWCLVPLGVADTVLSALVQAKWARLVVATRDPVGLRRLFERFGRAFFEVELPSPSREEMKEWLLGEFPSQDEVVVGDWIDRLGLPELAHRLAKGGPQLAVCWLEGVVTAEPSVSVALVAALGTLEDGEVRTVSDALGTSEHSLRAGLDRMAHGTNAVLVHQGGWYRPITAEVGSFLILAAMGRNIAESDAFCRVLQRFDEGRRHAAIGRLAALRGGFHGARAPAEIAAKLIAEMSKDERARLLRTVPAAFLASEELFRDALTAVRAELGDGAGQRAAAELALGAHVYTDTLVRAWELLLSLGEAGYPSKKHRGLEELCAALLDPLRCPARRATEILREVEAELGANPTPVLASLARVAVGRWTAGSLSGSQSLSMAIRTWHHVWNADSPDSAEAFQAAGAALEALLRAESAEVREQGWIALSRFAEPAMGGEVKRPESLIAEGRRLIGVAIEILDALEDWLGRALAEEVLVGLIGPAWSHEAAVCVLDHLSRQPLYLMFRATFWRSRAVLNVDTAIHHRDSGDREALWFLLCEPILPPSELSLLVDRLIQSAPSPQDVVRLLAAGDRALGVRWVDTRAMTMWAERQPALFESLVFGPLRAQLSNAARRLVDEIMAPNLRDEAPGPDRLNSIFWANIQKFLNQPASIHGEDALSLVQVLRGVTERRNLVPTLCTLASHPELTVVGALWAWLEGEHRRAPLQPEQVEEVVLALLLGPDRLGLLAEIAASAERSDHPMLTIEVGSPLEGALLDALERDLAAWAASAQPWPLSDYGTDHLERLFGRLAAARPDAWWRVIPPLTRGFLPGERAYYSSGISEDDALRLLQAGPSGVNGLDRGQRIVLNRVVRRIQPDRLASAVEPLLDQDRPRAELWLRSAEPHPALIGVTARLLGILSPERVRDFVHQVGGSAHVAAWLRGEDDGTSLTRPANPTADAYEAEGKRLGGLVGERLVQLARHWRGD